MQRNGKRIGWLKCDPLGMQTQQVEVVKVSPKTVVMRTISATKIYWWPGMLPGQQMLRVSKDRIFLDEPGGEPRPL